MLHFDKIVFGPIHSRRLGSSLGVNLLPSDGKLCNFDCIYCECGWNRDNAFVEPLPTAAQVKEALELKLSASSSAGEKIDSITFSGNGEPTLNPDFAEIIDITIALRDKYMPSAKVSVLSNATRCAIPEIRSALRKVDNPILKLDAPTPALAALVNKPVGKYDPAFIVKALESFEGDFILQTMFLRSDNFDSASQQVLGPWKDIVRHLRPRQVMVYSLDRETPQKGLVKDDREILQNLVKDLTDEGINITFAG